MNNLKVLVLMAGPTALVGWVGCLDGGPNGVPLALLLTGGITFLMYRTSAGMVLRMFGARVIASREAPELYPMVERLRQRSGLPMPTVALAPRAMSAGPPHTPGSSAWA